MEKNKIQIKTKSEDLKGVYSNLMVVNSRKEEFILDFMMVLPPEGVLSSRVIVSPDHLKRMIKTFQTSIEKYEKQFGNIEISKGIEGSEEKIGFVSE